MADPADQSAVAASGSAATRSDYLDAMVSLLWPDAGRAQAVRRVVLPSHSRPRLLVPVRPRRAGMSAVLRYTAQQSPRDRLAGAALALSVGAGLCRALPAITSASGSASRHVDSIDDHLADVLGQPVTTALALTAPRPNRKPVLQVFDRSGHTIGFAKIGVSAYTDALVRAEAEALTVLASAALPSVVVPRLLSLADWHDHAVAVQSALPRLAHRRDRNRLLERAMVEVSCVIDDAPVDQHANGFVRWLESAAGSFAADVAPDIAARWHELAAAVVARRNLDLAYGAWHGDWTVWNCVVGRSSVDVWDWERFARPVPRGFDRLHFVLNTEVGPRRDRYPEAARLLVDSAVDLLAPWQVPRSDAVTVVVCYLLALSARFLAVNMRQNQSGRVEEWAYPAIRAVLDD